MSQELTQHLSTQRFPVSQLGLDDEEEISNTPARLNKTHSHEEWSLAQHRVTKRGAYGLLLFPQLTDLFEILNKHK